MNILLLLACTGPTTHDPDPGTNTKPEVIADTGTGTEPIDADNDGYPEDTDCDDNDASVNPGATEVCGPADEDCDGLIDDDDPSLDMATTSTWYQDEDQDNQGTEESATQACQNPGAEELPWSQSYGDCDDSKPEINTDASEVCGDGVDNNCDEYLAACRLSGELRSDDAFLRLRLTDANEPGGAMAWLDVNGDGVLDLLVTDRYRDSSAGAVYAIFGGLTGTMSESASSAAVLQGSTGSQFGASMSASGDFNGDGVLDLAIGSPQLDTDQWDEGAAGLFLGGRTVSAGEQSAAADQVWLGWGAGDHLGRAVQFVGDLNGDGFDDLAMTGDGFDTGRGVVAIVPGSASLDGETLSLNDVSHLAWRGSANYTYLGTEGSISGAIDLDGDGRHDLAVGEMYDHEGGTYAGELHLIYGGDSFTDSGTIDDAEDAGLWGQEDQRMGAEVEAAGDHNGDGYDDIWVAGLGGSSSGFGDVYLIPGGASRHAGGAAISDVALVHLHGDRSNELFGSGLSTGDLDGDGNLDLVAGSASYSPAVAPPLASNTGSAHIFYGPLSGSRLSSSPDAIFLSGSDIGLGSVLVGDGDNDGNPEVLFSALDEGLVIGFEMLP